MTSLPLLNRTRVIFRSAEFGFFGVIVRTCKQTPCFCGHFSSTGDLLWLFLSLRRLRTSWLMVGIERDFWGGEFHANDWTQPALRMGRRIGIRSDLEQKTCFSLQPNRKVSP